MEPGFAVQVSFHVGGYGPVSFRFDAVEHPLFVRDAAGYYVRFDDLPRDPDLLRWLQGRVAQQLGELLFELGVSAPRDAEACYIAGLSWVLGQIERRSAAEAAVREARLALGLAPESLDVAHLTEDEAVRELGGDRTRDGFGLGRRRLRIEAGDLPDFERLRSSIPFR
jgi:hypothetical protein